MQRLRDALIAVTLGAGVALLQAIAAPVPVVAHGGGLDSRGCHNDRQRGGYHCHRGPLAGQSFGSASEAIAAMGKLSAPAPPAAPAPASKPQSLAGLTPAAKPVATPCALGRTGFERMVISRMQAYETAQDSLSARAAKWRAQIASNVAAGRATDALDAVYGRYSRHCTEGDALMAGIAVGEWVGISLRDP